MKKQVMIILSLLLVGVLFVSSCTPTGTDSKVTTDKASDTTTSQAADEGLGPKGELPIVKDKLTYNIMAPQTGYILDLNTNEYSMWLEEKTNIKIEYEQIPESAVSEKVSLALATLTLPDAFLYCGITQADQVKYGSQNVFSALNKYFDDHSVYTIKAYEENAALPGAITAPDGNIYALAAINECYHCSYAGRAWINQEWLDRLNLDYPETTDDFKKVLQAFKTEDANGNGDPNDEIPYMGSDTGWNTRAYEFLLQSFVYNDYGNRLALIDGKVEFTANTEAFRNGLRYIRELLVEELIDPVSLTQLDEQARTIAGNPDEVLVGVVTGATWWNLLGDDLADPLKRSRQYIGLSPLAGPDGVRNVITSEGGFSQGHFVITQKAANPEILFRWADYQMSDEATLYSSWGPNEGTGWKTPDEGVLGINGKPALYEVITWEDTATVQNYHMTNVACSNRTNDFRLGQAVPDDPETFWGVEPRLFRETNTYYEPYRSDYAMPNLMMSAEDSETRATLGTPITDYALESIVAFLAGNQDLEKDWDTYVAEYEALKLDDYLDLLQKAYDSQYGG